jgi:hypothetical protein
MRMRWFTLGFTAGLGGAAYAALRLRKLREALTPRRVASSAANRFADALDAGSKRLSGEA